MYQTLQDATNTRLGKTRKTYSCLNFKLSKLKEYMKRVYENHLNFKVNIRKKVR